MRRFDPNGVQLVSTNPDQCADTLFDADCQPIGGSARAGAWSGDVKAQRRVQGASFDPGQVKILCQAFDEAWAQIGPSMSFHKRAAETARTKLANAVVIAASAGPLEVERIKAEAMAAMFARPVGFNGPTRFGTMRR